MTAPAIAVLLPFHGAAPYLSEALASVDAEGTPGVEVCLIADGPDDDALAAASSFCDQRPAWRIVSAEGAGIAAALQTGVRSTHAPLIARLDADDRMLHGRLARQAAYLAAMPDVAVVGSQVAYIDRSGRRTGRSRYSTNPGAIDRMLRHACPVAHPSVMMRRSALEAAGGYRDVFLRGRVSLAEDYDLWQRIDATGGRVRVIDEVMLEYRQHSGQISALTLHDTSLATIGVSLLAARARHGLPEPFPVPLPIDALAAATRDPASVRRILDGLPRRERRALGYALAIHGHRTGPTKGFPGPFPARTLVTAPDLVARELAEHIPQRLGRLRTG